MTLHTLILILLWSFAILFLSATFIITYLLGKRSVKDNPLKGAIFIKTGKHINIPIKAEIVGKPSLKGSRFRYGQNTIFVPSSYADNYYRGRRAIYINRTGQLIASPFTDDVKLSSNEKNELIYELVESHIGSDAIRALKGKSVVNVLIVAVIAFAVGAIIVFGIIQFQNTMSDNQISTPTQQQAPVLTPKN